MTGPDPSGRRAGVRLGPTVFDPAPVAVAVTEGPEHRLVYTNDVYRRVFGERALGSGLREVYADLGETRYFDLVDRVYQEGAPLRLDEAPVTLDYPGGRTEERFFSYSVSRFSSGPVVGLLVMALDVTDQVRATRRLHSLAEERRRSLQRYRTLVDGGTHMVWVAGPRGGPIEPSPGWEAVTGQTWEEFRGEGWLQAVHSDDREATLASWNRTLAEQTPMWRHAYRIRVRDGGYRHFEVRAVPVREDDEIVEWVGTCTDVEQLWREQRSERLLARAAVATADTTHLDDMLTALAGVIVPELADACGIHLFPQGADRPPAAPFTVDRVAEAVRPGLPARTAPPRRERVTAGTGFARAVESRRPVHAAFHPGLPPPGLARPGTERWMRATGANSLVVLPVVVDGAVAAVVTAISCGNRPPLDDADIDLMNRLLDRAHPALRSALEFERTQRVALALQNSLLTPPPGVPGLRIAARYRPSPAAAEIGGDWYDAFVVADGATMLAIGDVAGHDLPAAVMMSQMRNMLRGLAADRLEPPGEILRRLDEVSQTLYGDTTATCVLGRATGPDDDGAWRFSYSVAGHPPPLLLTVDGGARFLAGGHNPLLGLTPGVSRTSAEEELPPHATVLLYTDGLIEHPGEHLDTALERLRAGALALAGAPLPALCDELVDGLPTTGRDDIALIALRVHPE